ncbi:MAG: MazG nucleotide pyrophosphohydrolase domain-containing protein [Patescibacteria group bacterium]
MKKELEQLLEFHQSFGAYWQTEANIDIPDEIRQVRKTLISEEAKEVCEAIDNEPLENIAKELADLLYVTYGAIINYGLQDKIEEIFAEVHRSNMSKLGEDGKPVLREDGKVLKGPHYSPADVRSILESNN